MRGIVLTLLVSCLMLFAIPVGVGHSQTPQTHPNIYQVDVSAPSSVYSGQNFTVFINCTYGWENYSVTAYFAAYNLSGISPSGTFHNFTQSSPYFRINATAPDSAETLYLFVSTTVNVGKTSERANSSLAISVFKPVILKATISNPSYIYIYNVTVNYYIDGNHVGKSFIRALAPESTKNVSVDIVYPHLSDGEHSLTINVSNALVRVNGQISFTQHFYYGTPPNFDWIYYASAIAIVFGVLLALSSGKRAGRLSAPKWRKK
ncbi:MAG: hypothetical protein M1162_03055 [Candidatus Thermoplasmatota archaeon]|nr:hypothetical protein [Candidatus Thermoplasmatota archaeon]